jgi:hypothetical protein
MLSISLRGRNHKETKTGAVHFSCAISGMDESAVYVGNLCEWRHGEDDDGADRVRNL